MKYIPHYDVASIMLTSILLLVVFVRKTYPTRSFKLYHALLFLNLIASIADFITAFTISYPEKFSLVFNYFINIVFLMAHNLTGVVFLLYILALIRGNDGTRAERIYWKTAGIVSILLILTSPLTKLVFYFDENLIYRHGPLMAFLYATAYSSMLYAFVLFIRHRKQFSVFQTVTNVTFLLLVMGAVAFTFFVPSYLIVTFSCALSFLMMLVALDNPAIYFYRSTYCFNQNAFALEMADKFKKKVPFTLLAFTFDDIEIFERQFGDDATDNMVRMTITVCHSLFGRRRVYYLPSGCFVIDLDEKLDLEGMIELLSSQAGKNIRVGDEPIPLKPHFCVFQNTAEATASLDVLTTIETMLFDIYERTNQHVIYNTSEVLEAKHRETRIVHMLRDAIENDGFDVVFQPIYDQKHDRFISAEALVRLKQKPGADYVGPDVFIPIAEQNGMILEIGEIVLEKVCRFWRNAGLSDLGIRYLEVNLSILQLLETRTATRILELCQRYELSPSNINLEITETASAPSNDKGNIQRSIAFLCEKGFTFSLDDYGSGNSPLSFIAQMPFTIIKIDKGILWHAMSDPNFRLVLDKSVDLIRSFGKLCLVEGVETEEMAQLLTRLGCDFFQGYLYAKPLSGDEFVQFLKEKMPSAPSDNGDIS